jgi:hypothetical protein
VYGLSGLPSAQQSVVVFIGFPAAAIHIDPSSAAESQVNSAIEF